MRLVYDPCGHWIGRPALLGWNAADRPPVAMPDTAFAEEGGPSISISVLDNDIEPEGGTLHLVSAVATHGLAVPEADGTVTYTPAAGVTGTDSVTYEVSDPSGQIASGVVSVVLGTSAPTAVGTIADQNLTHNGNPLVVIGDVSGLFSGTDLTFSVSGYAGATLDGASLVIDPTEVTVGTPVTLTATNANPVDASVTFNLVVEALGFLAAPSLSGTGHVGAVHEATATANRPGALLTYRFLVGGAEVQPRTAVATYTPAASDENGSLEATVFAALDGVELSAGTNTIDPIQFAPGSPPAVADSQIWTVDDTAVVLDASASGTGLVWSYTLGDAAPGVSISTSSGLISGTPLAASSGTATVTATDQYGRQVQDTFTWSAALRSQATAGFPPQQTFSEGDPIQPYDIAAEFTANGNTLSYIALDTLPAGLSLASDGVLSGTPTEVLGEANYTIQAIDEYGRTTDLEASIEIMASVPAPVAAGALGDKEYTTGIAIPAYDISADFTGSGLSYDLAPTSDPLPAGLWLSAAGLILGTPSAVATGRNIVVRGANAGGAADSAFTLDTVTLTATDNDDGTYAIDYGADTPNELTVTINGKVYADDTEGNPLNAALLDSVPAGRALALDGPVVILSTDGGTPGELDSGDLVAFESGVWLYPAGQAAPTLTRTWRDQSGVVQGNHSDYIGDGTEDTVIFARETDGTTILDSAPIFVAPPPVSAVSRTLLPVFGGPGSSATVQSVPMTGFSSANGDKVVGLVAFKRSSGSGSPTFSVTLGGIPASQVVMSGSGRMRVIAFEAPHPGTGNFDLVVTRLSGNGVFSGFAAVAAEIANAGVVEISDPGAAPSASAVIFDRDTAHGSYFLAGLTQDNTVQWASAGFSGDPFDALIGNNEWALFSENEIVVGASPQSFSMSRGSASGTNLGAVSVYVTPG